jgi:hypothetical protein
MASADTTNGNGTAKWLGVTAETWVKWFQTVGVSTALVAFMCLLAWKYVPPVVDGHLRLLESTSQTLAKMDETLRQSTVVLQEIVAIQKQTKTFFESTTADHRAMAESLEAIRADMKRNGS